MSRKLNGEIWKNGKKFIPLNVASVSSGYHREYLRQLIKNGKLTGERIKSSWFIGEDVLSSFIKNNPIAVPFSPSQNYSKIENKLAALKEKLEKTAINLNYIKNEKTAFKSAVVKSLSVVLIIFASVFFTKNFDRATAGVLLAGRQAQLAAISLQETAVGTAADIQETALNLPSQARSFAEQTLNQVRSLSLSLSLSANKLIHSANKSPNS